jgi:penicillin-binding protein 1A
VAGYDLAGKTGTTSDYRDAWFIGFTGGFTAAVWLGKDNNTPMTKVTGGGAPAEIWRNFMAAALPRLAAQPIPGGAAVAPPSSDGIGNLLQDSEEPAPRDGEAPRDAESAPQSRDDSSQPPM